MSFNDDLAIGELAESWVADALSEAWGHNIIKNPDKETKSNDLIDQSTGATIEVKHDRMIAKTGNVALEYECNGKPSGIKASTATYWVYVIKGDIWIAERQAILR